MNPSDASVLVRRVADGFVATEKYVTPERREELRHEVADLYTVADLIQQQDETIRAQQTRMLEMAGAIELLKEGRR